MVEQNQRTTAPYASFSQAAGQASGPGHLMALAPRPAAARSSSDGGSTPSSSRRWLGGSGSGNRRTDKYWPGARAAASRSAGRPVYLSAGLECAKLDVEEVQRFLTAHALCDRLT